MGLKIALTVREQALERQNRHQRPAMGADDYRSFEHSASPDAITPRFYPPVLTPFPSKIHPA